MAGATTMQGACSSVFYCRLNILLFFFTSYFNPIPSKGNSVQLQRSREPAATEPKEKNIRLFRGQQHVQHGI